MPVFVGRQFREMADTLYPGADRGCLRVASRVPGDDFAERRNSGLSAIWAVVLFMHGKVFERGAGKRIPPKASLGRSVFKQLAVSLRQGNRHRASAPQRITGPSFRAASIEVFDLLSQTSSSAWS